MNIRVLSGIDITKEVNLDCHVLEIIVNTWIIFTVC